MRRWSLPLVTVALVILNLLAYGLELAGGGQSVCEAYGLVPARFMAEGTVLPLFTAMFLHDPSGLVHIGGNLIFLTGFGALVERQLGGGRFLALYVAAGLVGGLMHVLVNPAATDPMVGASGAIFGVMAVAGALRPRLLGFVGAYVAINVWYALTGAGEGVSFGAHLGGFLVGFIMVAALRIVRSESLEVA